MQNVHTCPTFALCWTNIRRIFLHFPEKMLNLWLLSVSWATLHDSFCTLKCGECVCVTVCAYINSSSKIKMTKGDHQTDCLFSDWVSYKLWEEFDFCHDTECPNWDQDWCHVKHLNCTIVVFFLQKSVRMVSLQPAKKAYRILYYYGGQLSHMNTPWRPVVTSSAFSPTIGITGIIKTHRYSICLHTAIYWCMPLILISSVWILYIGHVSAGGSMRVLGLISCNYASPVQLTKGLLSQERAFVTF